MNPSGFYVDPFLICNTVLDCFSHTVYWFTLTPVYILVYIKAVKSQYIQKKKTAIFFLDNCLIFK